MTRTELATGIAVTVLIVLAGLVATPYVNGRIPAPLLEPPSADSCIDTGSRWKNWSWPNVPWLSPPCKQDDPPRQQG